MGRKVKYAGINLIHLKGTYAERARQHGELLKEEIGYGPIKALAKKNQHLIHTAGGPFEFKPLANTVEAFYNNLVIPLMKADLPEREKTVLEQLTAGSGLDKKTFERAFYQADGLMLLSRTSIMKYLFKDLPARHLPGCSSSVVARNWTKNGKLLVARNQDYPVVGPWEKATTVMVCDPSESDEIPHVSVVSAGLHTSGLTTMNQEGITVAAHAHFGKDVRFSGNPIFVVGEHIASKAKTIEEAIAIANQYPRKANWTLVVSSGKENDAVTLEMTPRKLMVRRMEDGFINHTNFFHNPALKEDEALISSGRYDDDWARLCRMRQFCSQHKGDLTPGHLAQMLGDHIDPWTNERRIFQNTLSVMSTVKSVVFSPEEFVLYVSTRDKSPVGIGKFVKIEPAKILAGEFPEEPEYLEKPFADYDDEFLAQVDAYRDAYIAWQMGDVGSDYKKKTLECLKKACSLGAKDPHIFIQTAVIAMKVGDFACAREFMDKCPELPLSDAMRSTYEIFNARLLDIEKKRETAVETYKVLAKSQFPTVRAAAKKGLKRPYKQKDTASIALDMQYGDPFNY